MERITTKQLEGQIEYINEIVEDEYDAAQLLAKLDNRNRMLVKWTKFGPQVIIKRGDKV